jgi:hypothetical protein
MPLKFTGPYRACPGLNIAAGKRSPMRGFLFKYQADASDKFLRDQGPHISDPDFWSNSFPIWAVCGVYFRKCLKPGDVLFFIPQKRTYPKGMPPYHFTGFLTCTKKVKGSYLRCVGGITANYVRRYRKSLNEHLTRDKERTKRIRAGNVVIGEAVHESSRWFGDQPVRAQPLMRKLGLSRQLRMLGKRNNNIPPLDEHQTLELRRKLASLTRPSGRMGPFPPQDGALRCTACNR